MNNALEKKEVRKSKIGGQALIEGVMMRGIDGVAMAVRLPSGVIDPESWEVSSLAHPKWYRKIPFVRGIFNLVESLVLGFRCLTKSAEKAGIQEEQGEPSFLERKFGERLYHVAAVLGAILGVAVAVGLFVYLPMLVVQGLSELAPIDPLRTLLEGIVKLILFILYLWVISFMKDIKRTFAYHGAEHKTIACYEADAPLTPENASRFSRFHPRCGTSFLLIVLIISILAASFVTWDNLLVRFAINLLLLPAVVGVSYELIRLAGRYDNRLSRAVSAPGLWLQRITTREPDREQLEVAIAALQQVLPENPEEDHW